MVYFVEGMKNFMLIDLDELKKEVLYDVKKRFKDVCKKVIEVFSNLVLWLVECVLVM